MNIYVSHSTKFDYQHELYQPLRSSDLNSKHQITLPHEHTTDQFDSKAYLKTCHLVLAEVSYPSTGQGIELGWANAEKVPVVCFYRKGSKPSDSLRVISDTFIAYESKADMISKLSSYLLHH